MVSLRVPIRKLRVFLNSHGFVKNVMTLSGASVLGQSITIFSSFFLTRVYSPEDFGILAIFTSLLAQFLVFASFRYERAIALPKEDSEADALLMIAVMIVTTCSIITAILVSLFSSEIANVLLNSPELEPFLWLFPITVFFAGSYQALSYWTIRSQAIKLLALTRFSKSFWMSFTQVTLGLLTSSGIGLLIGVLINHLAGTGVQARYFIKKSIAKTQKIRLPDLKRTASKYFMFSFVSVNYSFINTAGLTAPIFFLTYFYTAEIAGSFALTKNVIYMPFTFISASISQVFIGKITELKHENPAELKQLLTKTSFFLGLASALVSVVLFFSPSLFPIVFGEDWYFSGVIAKWTIPLFIASSTISPITILEWLDKNTWALAWSIARLVAVFLAFYISAHFGLSALVAIALYSLVTALMYVMLLVMNIYAINSLILKHEIV